MTKKSELHKKIFNHHGVLGMMVVLLSLSWLAACNKNTFRGNKNEVAPQPVQGEDALPEPPSSEVKEESPEIAPSSIVVTRKPAENLIENQIIPNFRGGYEVKSLAPNEENHIWLATSNGLARHLRLENGQVVSSKAWTGLRSPGAGGSRTYVLEGGGVVVSKEQGHLYFLHDAIPEGALVENASNYYQIPNVPAGARACVVSYRRDGNRYIGIGYGVGMFVEIPQENTPPYAPKFNMASAAVQVHNAVWGYSCYIDQVRLLYYGQFVRATAGTRAVNLRNKQEAPVTTAPNAGFVSNNIPNLTVSVNGAPGANQASYAMAGDRLGNVLNATNYYTLAFEPKTNSVWGSHGTNLSIYPHNCFYNEPNCNGFATYNLADNGAVGAGVGPLSALGDGSMVGVVRTVGDVYLFRLKDPLDFTKGIDAVKIAENIGGDPYMYTDFTGATLYLNNSLNEYDFTKLGLWKEDQALRQLGFTWQAAEAQSEEWKDIRAEVRCFADPDNKGEFSEVAITAKAKTLQFINVDSCRNKKVTHAELRLTQLNNQVSLMGVEKVQLTAFQ
ncbi:MAG: hypothetical protein ACOH5I_10425 [Oligoflexus sp.]